MQLKIIAEFPPSIKARLFQLSYPRLNFLPIDWHCYSGFCSNVRYLGHSKNLCLLTYLLLKSWLRQLHLSHESDMKS